MDKDFSEDFIKDMQDLLQLCMEANADTVTVSFDFEGTEVMAEMKFYFLRENKNGQF